MTLDEHLGRCMAEKMMGRFRGANAAFVSELNADPDLKKLAQSRLQKMDQGILNRDFVSQQHKAILEGALSHG